MNKIQAFVLVGFVATLASVSGCAHVDAIAKDVESCLTAEDKQVLKDSETAFVSFAESTFMCDPSLAPAGLLVCAEEAFPGACAALGPDASRFEECVVSTIENDPAAAKQSPVAPKRAHDEHAKLIRARNGR